ncbi:hypothetical protein AB1Y20_018365 [Prymnesium parvum]|uniref:Carboxymuconolactone decarboxylase-like domain-containing protein n=1 Tax=Prymnesium parvum TaxID=97485 RepID=A0AB34JN70_PRYPA
MESSTTQPSHTAPPERQLLVMHHSSPIFTPRRLLLMSGVLNVLLVGLLLLSPTTPSAITSPAALSAGECTPPSSLQGPPRFTGPSLAHMSAEQRAIYDEIAATRPTGVHGPFGPWLASPAIAQPAQQLGRVCRLETSLSPAESEMAILLTAARHNASTEWAIHERMAREAGAHTAASLLQGTGQPGLLFHASGVANDVIQSIKRRQRPDGLPSRMAAVHDFSRSLLDCSRVSGTTYEVALGLMGEKSLVELTAILGYYTLVAFTLNVFQIQP